MLTSCNASSKIILQSSKALINCTSKSNKYFKKAWIESSPYEEPAKKLDIDSSIVYDNVPIKAIKCQIVALVAKDTRGFAGHLKSTLTGKAYHAQVIICCEKRNFLYEFNTNGQLLKEITHEMDSYKSCLAEIDVTPPENYGTKNLNDIIESEYKKTYAVFPSVKKNQHNCQTFADEVIYKMTGKENVCSNLLKPQTLSSVLRYSSETVMPVLRL